MALDLDPVDHFQSVGSGMVPATPAPAALGIFGGLFGPPGPVLSEAMATTERLQSEGLEFRRMGRFLWWNTGWKSASSKQVAKLAIKEKEDRLQVRVPGKEWVAVDSVEDLKRLDALYGEGDFQKSPEPALAESLWSLEQAGATFDNLGAYGSLRALNRGQEVSVEKGARSYLIDNEEEAHLVGFLEKAGDGALLSRPEAANSVNWLQEHGFSFNDPVAAYQKDGPVEISLDGVVMGDHQLKENQKLVTELTVSWERHQKLEKKLGENTDEAWAALHGDSSERAYEERARAAELLFSSDLESPQEVYTQVLKAARKSGDLEALAEQAIQVLESSDNPTKALSVWGEVATTRGVEPQGFAAALRFPDSAGSYKKIRAARLGQEELVALDTLSQLVTQGWSGWSHDRDVWVHAPQGNYPNHENISLTSKSIELPSDGAKLRFNASGTSEEKYDFLRFEVLEGGRVHELKAYSGELRAKERALDLSEFAGKEVQVRLRFHSDNSNQRSGFQVADLQLEDSNGGLLLDGRPDSAKRMLESWLRPSGNREKILSQKAALATELGSSQLADSSFGALGLDADPQRKAVLLLLKEKLGMGEALSHFDFLGQGELQDDLETAAALAELKRQKLDLRSELQDRGETLREKIRLLGTIQSELKSPELSTTAFEELQDHLGEPDFEARRSAFSGLLKNLEPDDARAAWDIMGTPEVYGNQQLSTRLTDYLFGQAEKHWEGEKPWGIEKVGGEAVWSDSPGRSYRNHQDSSLTSRSFDLSGLDSRLLSIEADYDLENSHDNLLVEGRNEGGGWVELGRLNGTRQGQTREFSFDRLEGDQVEFRLRLKTDQSDTRDGVKIKKLTVSGTDSGGNSVVISETTPKDFSVQQLFSQSGGEKDRVAELEGLLKFTELVKNPKAEARLWHHLAPYSDEPEFGARIEALASLEGSLDLDTTEELWSFLKDDFYAQVEVRDRVLRLAESAQASGEWEELKALLTATGTSGTEAPQELALYESLTQDLGSMATANDYSAALKKAIPASEVLADAETLGTVRRLAERHRSLSWTPEGDWGTETLKGKKVWSDSPGKRYRNHQNSSLTSGRFSLAGFQQPVLHITEKHALENSHDQVYLESQQGDGEWTQLGRFVGQQDWNEQEFDLAHLADQEGLRLRFRLKSDQSETYDGISLSGLEIRDRQSGAVIKAMSPQRSEFEEYFEERPDLSLEQHKQHLGRLERFVAELPGELEALPLWRELSAHSQEPDFETRVEALQKLAGEVGVEASLKVWPTLAEGLYTETAAVAAVTGLTASFQRGQQVEGDWMVERDAATGWAWKGSAGKALGFPELEFPENSRLALRLKQDGPLAVEFQPRGSTEWSNVVTLEANSDEVKREVPLTGISGPGRLRLRLLNGDNAALSDIQLLDGDQVISRFDAEPVDLEKILGFAPRSGKTEERSLADLEMLGNMVTGLGSVQAAQGLWPMLEPYTDDPSFGDRAAVLDQLLQSIGLHQTVRLWPLVEDGLYQDPEALSALRSLAAVPEEWENNGFGFEEVDGLGWVWSDSPGRSYQNHARAELITPRFTARRDSVLRFQARLHSETSHDPFVVSIQAGNGNWVELDRWSGQVGEFNPSVSLADYEGQSVKLALTFSSDSSQTDQGVLLSSVRVDSGRFTEFSARPNVAESDAGDSVEVILATEQGDRKAALLGFAEAVKSLRDENLVKDIWPVLAAELGTPDLPIMMEAIPTLQQYLGGEEMRRVLAHISQGRSGENLILALEQFRNGLALTGNVAEAVAQITSNVDFEIGEDYIEIGDFDLVIQD